MHSVLLLSQFDLQQSNKPICFFSKPPLTFFSSITQRERPRWRDFLSSRKKNVQIGPWNIQARDHEPRNGAFQKTDKAIRNRSGCSNPGWEDSTVTDELLSALFEVASIDYTARSRRGWEKWSAQLPTMSAFAGVTSAKCFRLSG